MTTLMTAPRIGGSCRPPRQFQVRGPPSSALSNRAQAGRYHLDPPTTSLEAATHGTAQGGKTRAKTGPVKAAEALASRRPKTTILPIRKLKKKSEKRRRKKMKKNHNNTTTTKTYQYLPCLLQAPGYAGFPKPHPGHPRGFLGFSLPGLIQDLCRACWASLCRASPWTFAGLPVS